MNQERSDVNKGFDPQQVLRTAERVVVRLTVGVPLLVAAGCAWLDALSPPVLPSPTSQGPTPIVRMAGDIGTPTSRKVARPVPTVTSTLTPEATAVSVAKPSAESSGQELEVIELESKEITVEDEALFQNISTSFIIKTEGVAKDDWNEEKLRQESVRVIRYLGSLGVPRQAIRDLLYGITIINSSKDRWIADTRTVELDDPGQLRHELTHPFGIFVKPGELVDEQIRNATTEGLAESVYLALTPTDKSRHVTRCDGTTMINYERAARELTTLEKKFPDLRAHMIVAYWQYVMKGKGNIMPFDDLMAYLSSIPQYIQSLGNFDMAFYFNNMPVLGHNCGEKSRINYYTDGQTVRTDNHHNKGPRLPRWATIYPRTRQFRAQPAYWA